MDFQWLFWIRRCFYSHLAKAIWISLNDIFVSLCSMRFSLEKQLYKCLKLALIFMLNKIWLHKKLTPVNLKNQYTLRIKIGCKLLCCPYWDVQAMQNKKNHYYKRKLKERTFVILTWEMKLKERKSNFACILWKQPWTQLSANLPLLNLPFLLANCSGSTQPEDILF